MKKHSIHLVIGAFFCLCLFAANAQAKISKETKQCLSCHAEQMPGIIDQWQSSPHWQAGVGCYECHGAKEGEIDAMEHNGFFVATIVSPRDCGKCHVVF